MLDAKQLVEWLGPEGAVAGLEKSELTLAMLREIADKERVVVTGKLTRLQLIRAIIDAHSRRIDKPVEELVNMDRNSLRQYLEQVRPSRQELLRVLGELDVRPPAKSSGSLLNFVAREISDIGMYQRVAKGRDH